MTGPAPRGAAAAGFAGGRVEANGIDIAYVEAGEGPLVVLCHGFPESWYSWRHQLRALAGAGYRAVAPSMRGYGDTTAPVTSPPAAASRRSSRFPIGGPRGCRRRTSPSYTEELGRCGLRGGLNLVPQHGSDAFDPPRRGRGRRSPLPPSTSPASTTVIAGNTPGAIDRMRAAVTDLRRCELIVGAGHWVQQERPGPVNRALLEFLAGL